MVAESQLETQPGATNSPEWLWLPLPWCWLITEKYVLLDKLKAIKSISYTEKGAQNS